MQPFTRVTGIAVAMLDDDMNTDQIAPLQMARVLQPDYADLLFKRQRVHADGSRDPAHILNQERFRNPTVFVGGRNFGCGSSREAAVWCLAAIGVRCVSARSLADLFRENCLQNGVLPIELDDTRASELERRVIEADGHAAFTVDLERQIIAGPGGPDIAFEISASDRMRLIEGLDDIGFSLKHRAEIEAWEHRTRETMPWLQAADDERLS